MGNEKQVYYYNGIPDWVRIVSETIGLNATILPVLTLFPTKETRQSEGYYEDLVELSKCPQIDHIYVASDHLFREDKQGNYVDEDANIVDLCDEHVCLKPARVWDDIYRKKPEARKP